MEINVPFQVKLEQQSAVYFGNPFRASKPLIQSNDEVLARDIAENFRQWVRVVLFDLDNPQYTYLSGEAEEGRRTEN